MIQVADWQRGLGQGFELTDAGKESLGVKPDDRPVKPEPKVKPEPPADDVDELYLDTPYARGEAARAALDATPRPIVSPILLTINCAWFVVGIVLCWGTPELQGYLYGEASIAYVKLGGVYGPRILDGQWWRLVTMNFVHIGFLHLACNMVALLLIGPRLELLWGRWRFLAIYFLSGLGAGCAAAAIHPETVTAGASGALWGIMLAAIAWFILNRRHLDSEQTLVALRQLLRVLIVNLVVSFAPGVSAEGHFAGGIVGGVAAVCLDAWRPHQRFRVKLGILLCLLAIIGAMFGGLFWAMHERSSWRTFTQRQRVDSAWVACRGELQRFDFDPRKRLHPNCRAAKSAARMSSDRSGVMLGSLGVAVVSIHHGSAHRSRPSHLVLKVEAAAMVQPYPALAWAAATVPVDRSFPMGRLASRSLSPSSLYPSSTFSHPYPTVALARAAGQPTPLAVRRACTLAVEDTSVLYTQVTQPSSAR